MQAEPTLRDRSASSGAPIIEVNADAYETDLIIVSDGDTIALPCAVPAPCAEKIRLQGIDTPETFRPRYEAERTAGLKAKERLVQLVRGSDVTVSRGGRDRYGRMLGEVRARDRPVKVRKQPFRFRRWVQLIAATHSANVSAGVR